MTTINMVLQGKGGVGKSMIAALLAQHAADAGAAPLCIDTDPVNATFAGYHALNVQHLDILDGNRIDAHRFDTMIDMIACAEASSIVIDNGAASFVPLADYLIGNEVPALLRSMGHELVIHTVITGGQAIMDTLQGFAQLVTQFPTEARFVVWLNPFWGPVVHHGKLFEQMRAYLDNAGRVAAIVRIPDLNADTFGRDLSDMLRERLTFREAHADAGRSIMTRHRLRMICDGIYRQLDEL